MPLGVVWGMFGETVMLLSVGLAVFITKHMKTDKPNQVLLLETGVDNYCKVLYNGEYWYAKEKDVYGVTL